MGLTNKLDALELDTRLAALEAERQRHIATTPPIYRLPAVGGETYTAQDFAHLTESALDGPTLDGTNPLGDNFRRASFAAEAVATYGARTGTGSSESLHLTIGDLISDLRHLLDLAREANPDGQPTDLAGLVASSEMHYADEVRGG